MLSPPRPPPAIVAPDRSRVAPPAVAGADRAPAAFAIWRPGQVLVCWQLDLGSPCADLTLAWPDPARPALEGGPCTPVAAAFMDPGRLLLACDEGPWILVHRDADSELLETPPLGLPPVAPSAGACDDSRTGGLSVVLDEARIVGAPCRRSPENGPSCAPSRPPDPRPVPRLAGTELSFYIQLSAGDRARARWSPDLGDDPGAGLVRQRRRLDAALTFFAGVTVGFDPSARPRWSVERESLRQRAHSRAKEGCAP